ncbi:MAG: fimbrillin family protein [Alistipes sp.]|nr:fimbrillin family protein [Alistipes sp.]
MSTKLKIKTITAGVLAVAALAGCNVNDPISEAQKRQALSFTAGIAEATPAQPTRAAGEDWAAGDAIGIFMVENGSTSIVDEAGNKKYEVSNAATGAFEAATDADKMYYPQDGTVDFIAYYPYSATATLATAISVNIATTQTTANQPTFDLLYSKDATDKSNADDPVKLGFTHQLSKLVMNIVAGDGLTESDLTGMTVAIKDMNTASKFDLSTGSLGTPGTPTDIIPRTLTDGKEYDAIILPSEAISGDGDYSVEFIIDPQGKAEPFVWNMAAGTGFDGGNEYTYEVTLGRTEVTATGKIIPWVPNFRGQVTAD